jgi:hypothetical protein
LQLSRGKRHYPALFFSSIPSSSFHTRDLRALPFPFVALIISPCVPFIGGMQPCIAASVPCCQGALAAISLALRERLFALFLLSRSIFNLISTTQALKLSCGPFEHA